MKFIKQSKSNCLMMAIFPSLVTSLESKKYNHIMDYTVIFVSKGNEPKALKKKRTGAWNVQTGDNSVACVTKSSSEKSTEVHARR